jgi:hypothetical protein
MRKVILSLAVSLDNFIEGPNGNMTGVFRVLPYSTG